MGAQHSINNNAFSVELENKVNLYENQAIHSIQDAQIKGLNEFLSNQKANTQEEHIIKINQKSQDEIAKEKDNLMDINEKNIVFFGYRLYIIFIKRC